MNTIVKFLYFIALMMCSLTHAADLLNHSNAPNKIGFTPLMHAAITGESTVLILLAEGADPMVPFLPPFVVRQSPTLKTALSARRVV